ncbi:MAG: sodium-dependent transporter [Cyclobacteriaceae bacterium]|nr:sodium-dependent transporter [Cyclobacteriaceae bacterium]
MAAQAGGGEGRDQWGSKFGFIMAAAGSAVGLGNIWRFPYITGQNGGGAFVIIYIFCVVLIGVPLLFTEMGLGRYAGSSTVGAFKNTKANKFWMLSPILALSISFFVLTYYAVIGGWAVGYIFTSVFDIQITFAEFVQNPSIVLPLFAVFMVLTVLIVLGGISGGIEKASKILMPMLFVLLILVAIRSMTLDGAMEGIKFYLIPDWSKVTPNTFLTALSQAFFSMSIGWGIMITYGSYLPKKANIITSGLWVGLMDASVALLAGFMIFPAVFAFGMEPSQGPTLTFQVLPAIFAQIPFGHIVGGLFFLLLSVAALTSSISILEVPASYFMDEKKWSRQKSAWVVGILAFVVGIPSALTAIDGNFFNEMTMPWFQGATVTGFFDILDTVFGTFFIVVVALMTSVYVGWVLDINTVVKHIGDGSEGFNKSYMGIVPSKVFIIMLKYVIPVTILMVLLNMVGLLGIFSGA